jgi:methylenetetrahydrofolate dehydrogenase (NADP+)/methenyltetrahydrofolate cyclohydrolase
MKEYIRTNITEKRNSLDKNNVLIRSRSIIAMLGELDEIKNARTVGIYIAKDNEVETRELIDILKKQGKCVVAPKINYKGNIQNTQGEMTFKNISSIDDLEEGMFCIMEPKRTCKEADIHSINVIVIPCVAIDYAGNRIGRGKGYYDRFLMQQKNIVNIVLAYDFQIVDCVTPEKHDVAADIIVSDSMIIRTRRKEEAEKASKKNIIDGKALAEKILKQIKSRIESEGLRNKLKLVAILIGEDPASKMYVKMKGEKCHEAGIDFELKSFNDKVAEDEVIEYIKRINKDTNITGIMIQLPLPEGFDKDKIINTIDITKDVDGLTTANRQALKSGDEDLACCAPKAIIRIISEYGISTYNKKVVLVGKGFLIGYPLSIMLDNRGIKHKLCGRSTPYLKDEIKSADILIASTGNAHMISFEDVKEGAVVIDAGSAKLGNKIVGDVDFERVKQKASYITPTYGGIGPMTVAMLIENMLTVYLKYGKSIAGLSEKIIKTKPTFKRFNDLKEDDLVFDYHMHTTQTDGKCSAEKMIEKAAQIGLNSIAFTEHVTAESKWVMEYFIRMKDLKKDNPVKIIAGIEAKAVDHDGNIDATEEMIANADIVIGVVHRYPDGKGGFVSVEDLKEMNNDLAAEIEFKTSLALLENSENNRIDVLGHPMGMLLRFKGDMPVGYMKQLMIKAKEKKVAIEINFKYMKDADTRQTFLTMLREINPYVSFGSDAHNIDEIGRGLDTLKKEIIKTNDDKKGADA